MVNLRRAKLKMKRAGYDVIAVDKCVSQEELSQLKPKDRNNDGSE